MFFFIIGNISARKDRERYVLTHNAWTTVELFRIHKTFIIFCNWLTFINDHQ